MSIEERVADLERRMAAIEAASFHQHTPPSKRLRLEGFMPSEFVTLAVGGPGGPTESGTGLAETADARGTVTFDLSTLRLDPVRPPDLRVFRGRGQRSGRTSEIAVRDSGLTVR